MVNFEERETMGKTCPFMGADCIKTACVLWVAHYATGTVVFECAFVKLATELKR